VGDDPVAFAEEFVRSYRHKEWIDKERTRLTQAIDAAIGKERES
jgi:DNA-binding ferritin-like protein (Dps family)